MAIEKFRTLFDQALARTTPLHSSIAECLSLNYSIEESYSAVSGGKVKVYLLLRISKRSIDSSLNVYQMKKRTTIPDMKTTGDKLKALQ